MIFESCTMLKYVNLITFVKKLISKEHVVVIMEFPDWAKVKKNIMQGVSKKLLQSEEKYNVSSPFNFVFSGCLTRRKINAARIVFLHIRNVTYNWQVGVQ